MKNSKGIVITISISICFLLLFPTVAIALAGIAEHYSTLHYNQHTKVLWAHPGDICARDSETSDLFCLRFEREDHREFKRLENSLEKINAPLDDSSPYVIARRSIDNKWLVYNLEKEHHLVEEAGLNEALNVWASLGLKEPIFVNSRNPEKFLRETAASKQSRLLNQFLLTAVFGLGPAFILLAFFGTFTYIFDQRFQKQNSKVFLILSRVLMVPTGLITLYVLVSIGTILVMRVIE